MGLKDGDKGRIRLNAGIDQCNLNRNKREREIGQQTEEGNHHGIQGLDKKYPGCTGHMVDHPAPLQKYMGKIRKIGIQQHNLRNLAAGIAAIRNSDGAIRFPKRQKVIDPVSRHGHMVSPALQCHHQFFLLVGRHPGKDCIFFTDAIKINGLLYGGQINGIHVPGQSCFFGNHRYRAHMIA